MVFLSKKGVVYGKTMRFPIKFFQLSYKCIVKQ